MKTRLFLLTLLCVAVVACQKRMFPIAMTDEPEGGPEYTVEADPNK